MSFWSLLFYSLLRTPALFLSSIFIYLSPSFVPPFFSPSLKTIKGVESPEELVEENCGSRKADNGSDSPPMQEWMNGDGEERGKDG